MCYGMEAFRIEQSRAVNFLAGSRTAILIRVAGKEPAVTPGDPAPRLATSPNENRSRARRSALSRNSTGASPILTEATAQR